MTIIICLKYWFQDIKSARGSIGSETIAFITYVQAFFS